MAIVAFDRGNYTSYSACGIPYFIGKDVADVRTLIARTPEQFAEDHAIDARIAHEVLTIDLDRRGVLVRDLRRGAEDWEGFDQLMIATGAAPIRPPLPGADAQGIFGVQTLDDGLAVRTAREQHRPRRAVVVGAGYIRLELAEAFCALDMAVTVIDRGPDGRPGRGHGRPAHRRDVPLRDDVAAGGDGDRLRHRRGSGPRGRHRPGRRAHRAGGFCPRHRSTRSGCSWSVRR